MRAGRAYGRLARVGASLVVTGFLVGVGATAAYASGSYPTLANSNIRSGPGTNYAIVGSVPKGASVTIDCYLNGTVISGTAIWDRVVGRGYISDALVKTGSDGPVVPVCGSTSPPAPPAPPAQKYNRQAAANWALAHVYDAERFKGDDCTWYVSQALWAGGLQKSSAWTSDTNWLGQIPRTASGSNYLKDYLAYTSHFGTIQELSWGQNNVPQAQIGDVIAYDWGTIGASGNWHQGTDGIIDHLMIVTGFSGQYPLLSGHTAASSNQGWTYSNLYHNWYSQIFPGSRAYLIHVTY